MHKIRCLLVRKNTRKPIKSKQFIDSYFLFVVQALVFSLFNSFAIAQSPVAESSSNSISTLCNSLNDYDFQFFDKRFSLLEWQTAKLNLQKSCEVWKTKMQDTETIKTLSTNINQFNLLTSQMPDRMLAATIERLGPARDQGKASNCFANAGADLLGYHLGKRVSAFSVLIRGVLEGESRDTWKLVKRWKDNKSPFTNGELLFDGLSGSLRGAVCPEDQPNGVQPYTNEDLSQFWENYENGLRVYYGPTPPMKYINPLLKLLKKFSPSLNGNDFIENWKVSENGNMALISWQERNCSLKSNGALKINGRGMPVVDAINAGLKARAPVGIAYKVGFLVNQGDGWHASVIVAQMRVKGATQYLLRNSWGASSCKYYNPTYSKQCKEGHIWVYESDLKRSASAAYFYQ